MNQILLGPQNGFAHNFVFAEIPYSRNKYLRQRGVEFFERKTRISSRKLNNFQNWFRQLIRSQGRFDLKKMTKKYCDTASLGDLFSKKAINYWGKEASGFKPGSCCLETWLSYHWARLTLVSCFMWASSLALLISSCTSRTWHRSR